MIADPHCLFDFCLETDGAIAVVVTSAERARDLRRRPVPILGSTHGSGRDWGRSIYWINKPDETLASSGHATAARRLLHSDGVAACAREVAQHFRHLLSTGEESRREN